MTPLLAVLLVLSLLHNVAAYTDTPQLGPINDRFLEWREKGASPGRAYVPDPVDRSHLRPTVPKEELPERFDWRDHNGMTPVGNQGDCGACWSFATCAVLESWLKIHENEVWDFSENHIKNTHGFDIGHCDGGNAGMSTAYLARNSGPVLENEDPYDPNDSFSPIDIQAQKVMTSAPVFVQYKGERREIQEALMSRGPLMGVMYQDDALFDAATNTYYSANERFWGNHGIVFIGWDNDKEVPGAPGRGAWICKNSWGTDWGDNGYFYLSYYDACYDSEDTKIAVGFFDLLPADTYSHIYQHDPLGMTGSIGYGTETAYAANVFTAVDDASIVAVGVYAVATHTGYEIAVYDDGISGGTFTNPISSVSGVFLQAGYYVVDLPDAVAVTTDQEFAVVVRFETPGVPFPIPIERPISGYAAPTAESGQSYVSRNGDVFTDIHAGNFPNTNACIKAFAVQQPPDEGEDELEGEGEEEEGEREGELEGEEEGEGEMEGEGALPMLLTSIAELQDIGRAAGYPLDGHYILGADIDARETANWNDGAGFSPIGDADAPFTGVFDGGGHVIRGMVIDRPERDYVGLFAYVGEGGRVENMTVEASLIMGHHHVGALAGLNAGTITHCSTTARVMGNRYVGGLLGLNSYGAVLNCHATGDATGENQVGGLAGATWNGRMSHCYATGAATGVRAVGGLVGDTVASDITQCYAAGAATGHSQIGGLTGALWSGAVLNCYATGATAGDAFVGGLVGDNVAGAIYQCYAVGAATGETNTGGLAGCLTGGYADASFWDHAIGGPDNDIGMGLSTEQMQTLTTFTGAGWDFEAVWYMLDGGSYPYLAALPQGLVPYVTDISEANAVTAIESVGLAARISHAYSDAVPADTVISQGITAGASINMGTAVPLVVSRGPEFVPVPHVTGMALADAEAAITAAGLTVGLVDERYDNTIPAGTVISQHPSGGTMIVPGSPVDLVASHGPDINEGEGHDEGETQWVDVPNVVGISAAKALETLQGAGLSQGAITHERNVLVPLSHVLRQQPAAGATVPVGAAVALVVSSGIYPARPQQFIASGGARRVQLRWAPNREGNLSGYRVYRRAEDETTYTLLDTLTADVTRKDDTDVTAGNLYYYRLTAVADELESVYAGPVSARAGVATVRLSDVNLDVGTCGSVGLSVSDMAGVEITGFSVAIVYNQDVVDSERIGVRHTAITRNMPIAVDDSTPGVVSISAAFDAPVQFAGVGRLFHLDMCVRDDAPEEECSTLAFSDASFTFADGDTLEIDLSDSAALCFDQTCGKPGDMDNDGRITAPDAALALDISVGALDADACHWMAGDLNNDGMIDCADAVIIMRMARGASGSPGETERTLADVWDDAPADASVEISLPNETTTTPGALLELPVTVKNASGLTGLNISVAFPSVSSGLTLEHYTPGALLSDSTQQSQQDGHFLRLGVAADTDMFLTQGEDGVEALLLHFRVSENARPGTILPVHLVNVKLAGPFGEDFEWYTDVTVHGGHVRIQASVPGDDDEGEIKPPTRSTGCGFPGCNKKGDVSTTLERWLGNWLLLGLALLILARRR